MILIIFVVSESTRTVDSKYVLVLSNWAPRVALEAPLVQTFGYIISRQVYANIDQLSHQGTFGVWTARTLDVEFDQLSYGVNVFWKFRKFFLGLGLSFICPWRIKFHLHMDHGIVETHLISNDLIASSILQDVTWQSK